MKTFLFQKIENSLREMSQACLIILENTTMEPENLKSFVEKFS
jgi:hypothetical protein